MLAGAVMIVVIAAIAEDAVGVRIAADATVAVAEVVAVLVVIVAIAVRVGISFSRTLALKRESAVFIPSPPPSGVARSPINLYSPEICKAAAFSAALIFSKASNS